MTVATKDRVTEMLEVGVTSRQNLRELAGEVTQAARKGHRNKVARILLALGRELDTFYANGVVTAPLVGVLYARRYEMVKALLRLGCSPRHPCVGKDAMAVARETAPPVIQELLYHWVDRSHGFDADLPRLMRLWESTEG
jgi:hypothetical protein